MSSRNWGRHRAKALLLLALAGMQELAGFRLQAGEPRFEIAWHNLGGGGDVSTSLVFSVRGSTGQPEAGRLSGGPFSLAGGFWSVVAIQTPGAPALSIERTNQGLRVVWPLPAAGFVLEETFALPASAEGWTPVALPYQTNATHVFVALPSPVGNRFFRLHKP